MDQLTIGIFHDDGLAKDLGKKATVSDMVFHHRKFDDVIFSFIHAVDDKLSVKTQILGMIDVAFVSAESITPALGETLLLIKAMGITKGVILVPQFSDTSQIEKMVKDSGLNQFEIIEKNPHKIMEYLHNISVKRNNDAPALVTIDHAFPVKGIGEVVLGYVRKGTIHTHDKLLLLPTNKEIIIRSIQMQDNDVKEAPAGSRVGLAIKGSEINELIRGRFLCLPESGSIAQTTTLKFQKNPYYSNPLIGKFHMTVGLQTIPVEITEITENSISFSAEKSFCYTSDDVVLFLNLNAEKLHFIGSAAVGSNF